MKCLNRKTIQEYIDNELSERDHQRVKGHLLKCDKCQKGVKLINEKINDIKKEFAVKGSIDIPLDEIGYKNNKPNYAADKIPSGVRIPIPAFYIMLLLILFMAGGLIIQGNKIRHLSAGKDQPEKEEWTMIKYANEDSVRIEFYNIDLSGYSAVKDLKVKIIKSEESENGKKI